MRPAGEPVARVDVTTTTNGAWSLRVQPRINTEYQAQYGDVMSGKLAVNVRPRITFQKVGVNKFLIVVLSNKTLAGQTVQVTRFVNGTGWAPLGEAQLATIARTDSIAVKTVTELVPPGTRLRAVMSDDRRARTTSTRTATSSSSSSSAPDGLRPAGSRPQPGL